MQKIIFTYEGFKNTNLGDYIQSLAAMQFVEDNDILYYHRDELSNYKGNDVKVVMNGWFTHRPQNWPPSGKIHPLFLSFHINSASYETLLSDTSIEYFKQYTPIGCRDEQSAEKLREKGVEAYFSSCLTTTLGYKHKYDGERKGIYIVDPVHYIPESSYRLRKYIFLLYYVRYIKGINKYITNIKRNNIYRLSFSRNGINRYMCIIRSYVLLRQILTKKDLKRAVILTQYHYSDEYPTNELRFARAKELLNKYARAELVITSRIHCALPCLGLETPVIFLQNMDDSEESTCRFKGLLNLLECIKFKRNKILSSKWNLPLSISNVKNRNEYKFFAENLIEKCKMFMA